MSAFALEDGVVYHTYSTYARGLDGLWGMYQWLDRAPKGRNETGRLVAPPRRVRQALSQVAGVASKVPATDRANSAAMDQKQSTMNAHYSKLTSTRRMTFRRLPARPA